MVEILVFGQDKSRGTGYLLAPSVVLTAAHVTCGASHIRIRSLNVTGEWTIDADEEWADPRLDIAVLRMKSETDVSALPASAFGRVGPVDTPLPCIAVGFPIYQMRHDDAYGSPASYRDPAQLDGVIPSLSNLRSKTLQIKTQYDPNKVDGQSPWSGMSGAAVFVEGRIVGVLTRDLMNGGGYLEARPLSDLYRTLESASLDEVKELIGLPGSAESLVDVSIQHNPRPTAGVDLQVYDKLVALMYRLRPAYAVEARRLGLADDATVLPVTWRTLPRNGLRSDRCNGRITEAISSYNATRNRQLVFLGRSGSGKTAVAYRLAKDCIKAFSDGSAKVLPIVLPLSAWNPLSRSLYTWIVSRLETSYPTIFTGFPEECSAAALVGGGTILPILDGLDEMPEALRVHVLRELAKNDMPWVLTSWPDPFFAACQQAGTQLERADVVQLNDLTFAEAEVYLSRSAYQDGGQDTRLWVPFFAEVKEMPTKRAEVIRRALSTPLTVALAKTTYSDLRRGSPLELLSEELESAASITDRLIESMIDSSFDPSSELFFDRHRRESASQSEQSFRRVWNSSTEARIWLRFLAVHLQRNQLPNYRWWTLEYSASRFPLMFIIALASGIDTGLLCAAMSGRPGEFLRGAVLGAATGAVCALVVRWSQYPKLATAYDPAEGAKAAQMISEIGPSGLRKNMAGAYLFFMVLISALAYGAMEVLLLVANYLANYVKPYHKLPAALGGWQFLLPSAVLAGVLLSAIMMTFFYREFTYISRDDVLDIEPQEEMDPRAFRGGRILAAQVAGGCVFWAALAVAAEMEIDHLAATKVWILTPHGIHGLWGGVIFSTALSILMVIYSLCLTRRFRYLVARCWLAIVGYLPLYLDDFIRDAAYRGILRETGSVYSFHHLALQRQLAESSSTKAI